MYHATATLLALVCIGCQDANAPAPINWPSTVPGVWSGDLWFTYDEHGLTFRAFSCGALRARIVDAFRVWLPRRYACGNDHGASRHPHPDDVERIQPLSTGVGIRRLRRQS